ncbi:MAG: lysophospholipid acyltransferase family protein [Calditrichia bacterium]
MKIMHLLEYSGYRMLEFAVTAIPAGWFEAVSRFLGRLAFRKIKIRREVSLNNLKIVFPKATEEWREQIAEASYIHFTRMVLEFMKMRKWTFREIQQMVDYEGDVPLDRIAEMPPGIIVSAHFGNWEVGIGFLHTFGLKSTVIQQRQKNLGVNERMKKLREKWGMEIVYPRGAVRACVQAIGRGRWVALLGDQDAGDRGVFVPFFNRLSSTHVGAAAIHLKTGAPLYTANCVRKENGRFQLELKKLPFNGEETLESIVTQYNLELERAIRQHPEQYFWMHRRWKTAAPQK